MSEIQSAADYERRLRSMQRPAVVLTQDRLGEMSEHSAGWAAYQASQPRDPARSKAWLAGFDDSVRIHPRPRPKVEFI